MSRFSYIVRYYSYRGLPDLHGTGIPFRDGTNAESHLRRRQMGSGGKDWAEAFQNPL